MPPAEPTAIDRVVVDRTPWATRVAFLAGGRVVDIWVEGADRPSPLGGVALGRVVEVRRELAAATVAIPGGEVFVSDGALVAGAAVVVQVTRDAAIGKRPVARTAMELADGPVILTPASPGIGLSSTIGGKARRAALKAALSAVLPGELGLLVRAAAVDVPADALAVRAAGLIARWRAIGERGAAATPPAWLEPPPGLLAAASAHAPGVVPEIDDTGAAFETCGGGDALATALDRRVELAGGGELVVDAAEAATLIDVNLPGGGGREGFRRANEAAGVAALRQVRLRGLRGTVLLDLPRMADRAARAAILATLVAEAAADPTPTRVLGWTPGGLLELVREGARRPLADEYLDAPGPARTSVRAAAWTALAGLRREAVRIARPRLRVAPAVADWLAGPGRPMVEAERHRLGHLAVSGEPDYGRETFRVEDDV